MLEVIQERRRERERLIGKARKFVAKAKKFGKITAILYGSIARGDFNAWSDVDLILVSEGFPKDILKRQEMLHMLGISRVEPKGYRREEFLKMIGINHPFIKILAKEGILLKDELGIAKKIKQIKEAKS